MNRHRVHRAILAAGLALIPFTARAQEDQNAPPAPASTRASWTSDRRAFVVGEVLTVLVDEQTLASERTNRVSAARRAQRGNLTPPGRASAVSGALGFASGLDETSAQTGESGRQGRLLGTLSMRVAEIAEDGSLVLRGQREVTIDGRRQVLVVSGVVRPEDVTVDNVVPSSRIADATVSYRGNRMGPKRGIVGRLLGMLWP